MRKETRDYMLGLVAGLLIGMFMWPLIFQMVGGCG